MRRQLALRKPYLTGEDVAAVQRALGGLEVDGVYGPLTAARVRAWKWATGYALRRVNTVLTPDDQAFLLGEAGPPMPLRPRRVVRPLDTEPGRRSEFWVPDPQGAPADNGVRYHAGKDWFAPAGSTVRAPVAGLVVEARRDGRTRGQIFGGCVKIEDALGRVWVFRHVDPRGVTVGRRVRPAERVATVTPWLDGPPHAHIEVWKTLRGGYDFENMLDPMTLFG